ncbi:MAG: hypothetical protein DK304_001301 [Chloroflexi bacterium]|jgi:hypothetical protein|nr:MAG: hypothetical protein DK304_001301 [Chloroflexota bacterium]
MNKQNRLIYLIIAIVAVAAAAVIVTVFYTDSSQATDWTFGEALTIRVKEMRLVEEVFYSIEEKHYVVRPSQQGKMIAAAHIELRNRQAGFVILDINETAARLRDSEFLDYQPLNPFNQRAVIEKEAAGEELLIPFLWADGSEETPTIQLNQICDSAGAPCELVGWLFFEVPKDIEYHQFIWETGDTVYMPFSGTR